MIIGICDDDILWCEYILDCIHGFCNTHSIENTCLIFQSKQDLLLYDGRIPDILFMDIELEEIDNEKDIHPIEQLNIRWKNCQIVYLTNYLYYAKEVSSTRCIIYYVPKEQFKEKLPTVFQTALHEIDRKERQLLFTLVGGDTLILHPKEILYMERDKRVTQIVTSHKTYMIKDKIDQLAKRLPSPEFTQCHNSILIHLPSIEKLNRESVFMKNGAELSISRSYRKTFSDAFLNWAKTQIF